MALASSRAYEGNEEYFNEIKKLVLDLDITYPHIATQADLNSLFRDTFIPYIPLIAARFIPCYVVLIYLNQQIYYAIF